MTPKPLDTANENQFTAYVDAEGYVVGGKSTREKVNALAAGGPSPAGVFTGHVPMESPRGALVFSGQGPQWPGMARDLYLANSSFRATVRELDAIMRPRWGRSLVEELLRGDDSVYQSEIGQPILFALQVGVYRQVRSWGVTPTVVPSE